MRKVILSTAILLEEGLFKMEEITLEEAVRFSKDAENFCGHETVRILGLEPTERRDSCTGYDVALVLRPNIRLEFGREYSLEEMHEIGFTINLITKLK